MKARRRGTSKGTHKRKRYRPFSFGEEAAGEYMDRMERTEAGIPPGYAATVRAMYEHARIESTKIAAASRRDQS